MKAFNTDNDNDNNTRKYFNKLLDNNKLSAEFRN